MTDLTSRESQLVALGAALGSNCVPCIEHVIPQARKAGLTDKEIQVAILLADKIKQVPARKVLEAALILLPQAAAANNSGFQGADRTLESMAPMMAKCRPFGCAEGIRDASLKEQENLLPESNRGCC